MVGALLHQPQTPRREIWSKKVQSSVLVSNKLSIVNCAASYLIFAGFGEREIGLVDDRLLTRDRLKMK